MRPVQNSIITSRIIIILAVFLLAGCTAVGENGSDTASYTSQDFKDYWYSGKAELTRYRLEQARYGETHPGDAVLIFVTEDFLPDKQVKYEYGPRPANVQSVLKLNFTRRFFTGIYPYSTMTSVFTPVDDKAPGTLKATSSTQEWCGHVYMQLNRRDNKFRGFYHSYFQGEADKELELEAVLLEDEIWTKIRLNPQTLPEGEIEIIPGMQFLRLRHQKARPAKAIARLTTLTDKTLSDKPLTVYRIEYQDIQRVVEIKFESQFPYAIVAWEERTRSGFGEKEKWLTTRAVKTHAIQLDYWNKNSLADSTYREMLGL